ncbi:MAG: oligoendopeptidase F [bacterium]|nr:MAG: oligoendopeptidase F [bacterium]
MLTAFLLAQTTSFAQSAQQQERSEISDTYKWKTGDVFASDQEWEKNFELLKSRLGELEKYRGQLSVSADNLLQCLQTRDQLEILSGKLSLYAGLKSDEDTRITRYQAYRDEISGLRVELNQKKSFIEPEILSIAEERLNNFFQENEALRTYRHYLDDLLRSRKHVLSPEGEQLLALSGDMSRTPYQIFSMFNNADIRFPQVTDESGTEMELTKGNFFVLMKSPDRQVRKKAFHAMYQTYQQWINTLSASLSGAVKRNIFYARARQYDSAREAALDEDNIPLQVYDNVIQTVNNNLAPLHQYMQLRKDILAQDRVNPWDLYVPLVKELKWDIPYEEGVALIEQALLPLGEDYVRVMKKGFREGWFDVFENAGKRSGAYSTSAYQVSHPFMLLNYQGMLDDVFTVAHEMGHSMHSYFTLQTQPYIYSDYTIFVAEVASTLNEALLLDYLLKNTPDKQKKLYLLNQYIDQIRGTLYIQSIFAEFEMIVHEKAEAGEALTAEFLNQVTHELYSRYYGPAFDMDPQYDINWCRIPHFYYNFYVFQYATGISAATFLSQKILAGDIGARDVYLNFLKQGASDYSIDLLKSAGVDMTSPQPIEETIRIFQKYLDNLEELLKE